jgi:TP901 family phage tail tape measure protein
MPQNLSHIESELRRVSRAAADAETQMRLLEKAMQTVIIAGAKGSGAAKLTTGGAGVQNVAARALQNPYYSVAGSPVGGRAIVGGQVDTSKIQGIAREYGRLQSQLAQYHGQIDLLMKAEQAQADAASRLAAAKDEAATLVKLQAEGESRARRGVASQVQDEARLRNQLIQQNRSAIGRRVDAYNKEIAAVEEATQQQRKNTQSLAQLEKGIITEASELEASKPGRATGGAAGRRVYSEADLANIFGGQPGTAAQISATAGKAGFSASDIKSVTQYANAYTQVQFAAEGANGVMRKLVLTTDRAGNVMTSTQKQFRTFFGAIRRNVTEMIKWSAATLVVWGAIRKLGELLEIAIENESRLADIAVILGEEHADLTEVFNSAAEAAAATGESIDGVLDGYVQAFRATGNIADQTERAAQAQQLLTDALILSKLSALTTAQSMDVLSGALRQAGLDLDEGAVLLDKWVAVSRVANVGIETLAESFAITATSASNAGLEWDELNGIIATLAESTTLSATESGNAIRAFISGFTTDTAVKELTKYGIAVTDSTGETRGFLDVMKEISALFEQGIITESELNKISRAIGGGARREAQVATTIKNLGRAQEVAEVSARANGDAQRALSIQLDTVQTAITKLNNAFQKLARTMGSDGGVLDVAGGVLNIFVKLVDATSALVKNLGDMTPILAGMAVLFAATSKETRGLFATNIVGGIGSFLNRGTGGGMLSVEDQRLQAGVAGGFVAPTGYRQGLGGRVSQRLLGPGFGRNAGSLLGQGLAGGFTAISAIQDLRQGNQAGAAGSIAGGIIGGLISGGHPIGIVIGTAAGEAFANGMVNYKTEFSNFFRDIFGEAIPDPDDPDAPSPEALAQQDIFEQFGFGSEALGKFFAKGLAIAGNIGYEGGRVIGRATGGLGIGGYQFDPTAPKAEIDPLQIALAGTLGTDAADQIFKLQEELEAQRGFEAEAQPGAFKFSIVEEQKRLLEEYADTLSDIERQQADVFRAGAITGDVSDKQLKEALDQIPNLQSILTRYEAAFGDELRNIDEQILDVTDSFEFWTDIVLSSSTEQVAHLNTLANEIAAISNAIELARQKGGKVIVGDKEYSETEAQERRRFLERQAVATSQAQRRAALQERIVLPTVVDLDINEEDIPALLARMEEIQDKMFEEWWSEGLLKDFSESDIEETLAPFMIAAGKDGGQKYVEGFQQSVAGMAFEELVEEGAITPVEEETRRGLQTFDIPSGQLPAVMARYQELLDITAQAGYVPDEETFAGLFTDFIAMPITADLTLLNIAMQELIDVNKDQLDGIYNLPTDASFYVPFSGYSLGFVNQGGGGAAGLPAGIAGRGINHPLLEVALERLLADRKKKN